MTDFGAKANRNEVMRASTLDQRLRVRIQGKSPVR
jgi:hypothetical protein